MTIELHRRSRSRSWLLVASPLAAPASSCSPRGEDAAPSSRQRRTAGEPRPRPRAAPPPAAATDAPGHTRPSPQGRSRPARPASSRPHPQQGRRGGRLGRRDPVAAACSRRRGRAQAAHVKLAALNVRNDADRGADGEWMQNESSRPCSSSRGRGRSPSSSTATPTWRSRRPSSTLGNERGARPRGDPRRTPGGAAALLRRRRRRDGRRGRDPRRSDGEPVSRGVPLRDRARGVPVRPGSAARAAVPRLQRRADPADGSNRETTRASSSTEVSPGATLASPSSHSVRIPSRARRARPRRGSPS